jgi:hypothetical protein
MMSSQDAPRARTVSLRRARAALVFSLAMTVICAACGIFFLVLAVLLSAPAALLLLVAPVLGTVFNSLRAVRWSRAIRAALTSPDEYRWTP